MDGLQRKERILGAIWDAEQKSTLPDNLESIYLTTLVFKQNKGLLAIVYKFKNHKSCAAEFNAEDEGSL